MATGPRRGPAGGPPDDHPEQLRLVGDTEAQTVNATLLATLNAMNQWLRDGAPLDPATLAAVTVGAAGIRAGDLTHPVHKVIDIGRG